MAARDLPDFIIGGPPRSGTTSLFRHMEQHPQICVSSVKEPWFFTTPGDQKRFRTVPRARPTRWSWYEDLFAHCGDDLIKGEGSTVYFYAPGTPGLIHAAAPDVRLIFVLRDPIDRVYSHYLHDLRSRRLPPFEKMIDRDHPRLAFYLDVSRYRVHLERFRETFSPDQILVLFLEDLRDRAGETIRRAYEFVGADPSFVPDELGVARNTAVKPRSRLVGRIFSPRPLPWPALHRPWRSIAAAVRRVNTVKIDSVVVPEWRRSLLPALADDIERLEAMLGRRLDAWKSA